MGGEPDGMVPKLARSDCHRAEMRVECDEIKQCDESKLGALCHYVCRACDKQCSVHAG